jgi:hypothetical protein
MTAERKVAFIATQCIGIKGIYRVIGLRDIHLHEGIVPNKQENS